MPDPRELHYPDMALTPTKGSATLAAMIEMPNTGLNAEPSRTAAAVVSRLAMAALSDTPHWLHGHHPLFSICILHLGSSVYLLPTPYHLRPLF